MKITHTNGVYSICESNGYEIDTSKESEYRELWKKLQDEFRILYEEARDKHYKRIEK